jgi:cytochrome P450
VTIADAATLPVMPFERQHVLRLSEGYRELQRRDPVAKVRTPAGDIGWLVTGYPEVRALLADERLGRAHRDPDNAPRYSASFVQGGPLGDFTTEREEFARMRRLTAPAFVPRRVRVLEEEMVAIVERVLDDLLAAGPPADFQRIVSFPLPLIVVCRLLGVSTSDADQFRAWSEAANALFDEERIGEGFFALVDYMRELLEAKRREPGDDLVSDLIEITDSDGGISEHYLAAVVAGLLFAGHDTTMLRIGHGTLLLLEDDEQREALRRDPALAGTAVDELIRLAAPARPPTLRYAREDVPLGDHLLREGDLVLLAGQAANQDPAVFADPARLDITRSPNPHLTFGHGPRYCVGSALAKAELTALYTALFQRIPTLRLAVPMESMLHRESRATGGLDELPVTW